MVLWNAAQIEKKIRDLTGTPEDPDGGSQLSTSDILDYINSYYTFTMPFELKEQITHQKYEFYTQENLPTYNFPGSSDFLTNEPIAYVNGFPMVYYEDRDIFLRDYPEQFGQDAVGSGDGVTDAFNGTTQAQPVLQNSFFVSDGTQVAYDDGDGELLQDVGGTLTDVGDINYITGVWSVTFDSPPANLSTIIANYQAYIAAQPQGILFYSRNVYDVGTDTTTTGFYFDIRPVPDQVYKIELQGYINQVQFEADADVPLQTEWGQLIAYGAALEILADRGDIVAYNNLYSIFKRYENVALGRYVEQLQSQRSLQRF